jgi:selenocysteine lyase/cysteine desulfurase
MSTTQNLQSADSKFIQENVTCALCLKQYDGSYDCLHQPVLKMIRDSIIGKGEELPGPYGDRRLEYCDYTASGRPLSFIEDYVRDVVMPFYANTHTEASATGRQTNSFREDARQLVAKSLGCEHEKDAVIWTGSGSTGAIFKLAQILNIHISHDLDKKYKFQNQIPLDQRPVVFIGPYEHHSNELIWRETVADVITIPETYNGTVDLEVLKEKLEEYKNRPLKLGSFSAASNVTGIRTDVYQVSAILHKYGFLACWDFAAAAPYVNIKMNHYEPHTPDGDLMYLDAVYISPHKFVGGPGTPGVLAIKREICKNAIPSIPGGGTVTFVSRTNQSYDSAIEHREEGGTPAIIESIRCGLVFHLKDTITSRQIEHCEKLHIDYVLHRLRRNPRIVIMGNPDVARISILSMNIVVNGRQLHYNFVVALLNDLFGIQSRGGCSCAGPYGMRLFGLSEDMADKVSQVVQCGLDSLKPGWFRVNLNFFFTQELVRFICDAIEFIAEEGWKLLPDYSLNKRTGMWTHNEAKKTAFFKVQSLHDVSFIDGKLKYPIRKPQTDNTMALYNTYLDLAHQIVEDKVKAFKAIDMTDYEIPAAMKDKTFLTNCFFHLPHTVLETIQGVERKWELPWWAATLIQRPYGDNTEDGKKSPLAHSMHRVLSKAQLYQNFSLDGSCRGECDELDKVAAKVRNASAQYKVYVLAILFLVLIAFAIAVSSDAALQGYLPVFKTLAKLAHEKYAAHTQLP